MKKRKFKRLFKVILESFVVAIWPFLTAASVVYAENGHYVWLKLVLIAISVIYGIAGIAMIYRDICKNCQ